MKPSSELIKLVDKCLAKTISRTEMARLEELLEHDDALRYYLEITAVEGALPMAFDQAPPAVSSPKRAWLKPLAIAASAALLFAAGHMTGSSPEVPTQMAEKTTSPQGHSATITSLVSVSWKDTAPESINLAADSAPISLESGLMEITFASGVRALIEGPATIQVTGENHAHLTSGRLVADVPKGAEGFTVNHSQGKLVDLGTVFGLHIPDDQSIAEVGVFSGEVELYTLNNDTPVKIYENHAMIQKSDSDTPFESVPFQRDDFIRHLPSHEFPWQLSETPTTELTELNFDVSHLIWRSGGYRAVVKWMKGTDALVIHSAELFLDGSRVASDIHRGRTGLLKNTHDNTYTFNVPEDAHRKGKWTLKLMVIADDRIGRPESWLAGSFSPQSAGTLLFEDSTALLATDKDFLGTWQYQHNDDIHQRTFHSDHTASYTFNGKKTNLFNGAQWSVDDGILTLKIPVSSSGKTTYLTETHLLRDHDELIFINHPYRNARRVD